MYNKITVTKILVLSLVIGLLVVPYLSYAQEQLSKVYVDTSLTAGGYERGTCDQPYRSNTVKAAQHAGSVGATLVVMNGSQSYAEYQVNSSGNIQGTIRQGNGRPPECSYQPTAVQNVVYVDLLAPAGPEHGTCANPFRTWDAGVQRARATGADLVRIDQNGYIKYRFDASGQLDIEKQGSGRPPECPYSGGTYPYTVTGAPIPESVMLGGLFVLGVGFLFGGWIIQRRVS